jgi:hypothetical protein
MNEYPVQVSIVRPERSSRLLAIATLLFMLPKLILLIPHLVALYVLGIAALVGGVFGQLAVVITGRWPEGFHEFLTHYIRWQARVNAYAVGLTDEYPPFSLK